MACAVPLGQRLERGQHQLPRLLDATVRGEAHCPVDDLGPRPLPCTLACGHDRTLGNRLAAPPPRLDHQEHIILTPIGLGYNSLDRLRPSYGRPPESRAISGQGSTSSRLAPTGPCRTDTREGNTARLPGKSGFRFDARQARVPGAKTRAPQGPWSAQGLPACSASPVA
jgi:hypothetical protein